MKRKSLAERHSGKRAKPFLCYKTQSDEKITLIEKDKIIKTDKLRQLMF